MKILQIIPDLAPSNGGPASAVCGLAEALADLGHSVSIITTDYAYENRLSPSSVKLMVYPCSFSPWRYAFLMSKELPKLIAASDIVHIHTIWEYPTWFAAKICNKLRKPYILRPCGMLEHWSLSQHAVKKRIYMRLMAAQVIRNAAAIHFTTENEFDQSFSTRNELRAFVVPNGVTNSALRDLPGRQVFCQRFPSLKGKRCVLFLGRLHYKKQPDIVIKAFSTVCRLDDSLTLVLAGPSEPAYLAELHALVYKLHLTNRVIFTGLLTAVAVREAYCAAELFVLPSLQENFGIAVAEAMAAGCPVVVSEQVELATDIHLYNAGIVCKSDVKSTTEAMEKLLLDERLRIQMGHNGRQLVLNKFQWVMIVNDLIRVYKDVISSTQISKAWR